MLPFSPSSAPKRHFLFFLLFVFSAARLFGASATLEWDANSENDLAGYRIYYGTASGAYASTLDVGLSTRGTVTNLAAGQTYYFAVTAYNTSGMESAPSGEVTYAAPVDGNIAPVIAIASPADGSSYVAPASITFTPNVSDADGTVVRVEYFDGPTKIGESMTSPFTFTWQNVPAGNHAVGAVATDNSGAYGVSPTIAVSVVVLQTNQSPTISIASNGTSFVAPASVSLTATASDPDGSVSQVEYFAGGIKLGGSATAPYSFTWASAAAGNYQVVGVVTDNKGATTTSAPINISVAAANQAPSVTLASSGSTFTAPATYTLTATASDLDGIVTRVELYNGATKVGEKSSAPFSWTLSDVSAGAYAYHAVAVDDSGALATSADVGVTVNPATNALPIVAITSPQNNALYPKGPANISLNASASDSDGSITRVEFFNGTSLLGTATTAPYSYAWDNVPAGTYSARCVAYDDRGGSATSLSVKIVVNAAPTVTVTASGAVMAGDTLTISANASDSDGTIKRVEFYSGSILLGKDMNQPYQFAWKNVRGGVHVITAVAYDNRNVATTSDPVIVGITSSSQAPVVSSSMPAVQALGTSYEGSFDIRVQGEAGQIYDVWRSDNLKEWALMTTVLNADGGVVVTDPSGMSPSARFYRVSVR